MLQNFLFFIENVDEKVLESMKWLETNEAPWTEVLLHWSATYDLRKKDLYNNQDKDLLNIFSKWTHYKHPQGYNLINQDFNKMSLSNVALTESNFKRFFNIILQNFSINPKDNDGCEMLNKIKKEDLNNGIYLFIIIYTLLYEYQYSYIRRINLLYISDKKILTMLKLLPHLIPPKTMKKIDGVCKRASMYAAEKCMIRIVKVCTYLRKN